MPRTDGSPWGRVKMEKRESPLSPPIPSHRNLEKGEGRKKGFITVKKHYLYGPTKKGAAISFSRKGGRGGCQKTEITVASVDLCAKKRREKPLQPVAATGVSKKKTNSLISRSHLLFGVTGEKRKEENSQNFRKYDCIKLGGKKGKKKERSWGRGPARDIYYTFSRFERDKEKGEGGIFKRANVSSRSRERKGDTNAGEEEPFSWGS